MGQGPCNAAGKQRSPFTARHDRTHRVMAKWRPSTVQLDILQTGQLNTELNAAELTSLMRMPCSTIAEYLSGDRPESVRDPAVQGSALHMLNPLSETGRRSSDLAYL